MISNGHLYPGVQIKRNCPVDVGLRIYHELLEVRSMCRDLFPYINKDKFASFIELYLDTVPSPREKDGSADSDPNEDIWNLFKET